MTIAAYYKFQNLPQEVKDANKIRSPQRLECVAAANPIGYKGMEPFLNKKGQLFFYLTEAEKIVEAEQERRAEVALTNGSLNFSSLFLPDLDQPEFSFGHPNSKRLLSNRKPNPLYPFRNDGYLFLSSLDYQQIELLIIPQGRYLIQAYCHRLMDGGFEEEIAHLWEQAEPPFLYLNFHL